METGKNGERQARTPPRNSGFDGSADPCRYGSLHGYGIARRFEQISGDEVLLNQGTIYAALVHLQQRGWISSEWGVSDNNRKAKFYSITKRGRKQLSTDAAYWQRLTGVMGRL